jgi:5-methylcytosine-specific restriction endonuclease McrA
MNNTAAVLARPVLVLNRVWQPISVASAINAFALIIKGSACIIDPETYQEYNLMSWADVSKAKEAFAEAVIRTPRLHLVVPEVIRLTGYSGQGERTVVFSRRNIFKRDRYTCQYCSGQPGPKELTIDHLVPKSRGGKSEWTNCLLACLACNAKKANRTPAEAKMLLRKIPKKPSWTALAHIPLSQRRMSWSAFLSKAFWEIELEP